MFDSRIRILVADDMQLIRRFLVNALKDLGYLRVDECLNGREAYELLAQESETNDPYQFMISDWNMPEMTGIELLQKIRASSTKFQNIPFLMVTTESEKERVLDAIKKGANHYLVKPFHSDDLKARLQWIWAKLEEKKNSVPIT